jgi:hypothetical protein
MFRRYSRGLVRVSALAAAGWLFIGTAAAVPQARQAPAGQAPALPAAREVIDAFVKASGGVDAFKAVRSMRARGSLNIPSQGLSGGFEMVAARPNKTLTRVTIPGIGNLEEAFDGKVGWSIDPLSGPALVLGKSLTERADEAWFDAPLHEDGFVKTLTVVGRELFDNRPAYRLKVVLASGTEQFEIFDVENGFQIGLEATREMPFGPVPTVTIFRDYRRFGALTLPTTVVQRLLGLNQSIEQVVTFSAYEFDGVAANAFDMPPAIKALIK